jgi:opacity protein-like surface antigen
MKGVIMKKLCVFLAGLLFLGTTFAMSQPVAGKKFELGVAFSFASIRYAEEEYSYTVWTLPLRVGYFVWKGLEIEPEIMLQKFKGDDLAYDLCGNLAYNFKPSGNLVPFVLAGIGIGNGFVIGPIVDGASGVKAFLLNFGGGVKYVIGNSGAIRLEYRFTHNHLAEDEYSGNRNSHQVFIGASLFF